MPRFSQRSRRGSVPAGAGVLPAPGIPIGLADDAWQPTGSGWARSYFQASHDYPVGGTSWDVYADTGPGVPGTLRVTDAGPDYLWLSYLEQDGLTIRAFLRCWNANHTAFTDSAITDSLVTDTRVQDQPFVDSVDDLGGGSWNINWKTPPAYNWDSDEFDLLVETDVTPPTVVRQANAALDTIYQTGPHSDGETIFAMMVGYAPGHVDPLDSLVTEQALPP